MARLAAAVAILGVAGGWLRRQAELQPADYKLQLGFWMGVWRVSKPHLHALARVLPELLQQILSLQQ